MEKDHYTLKRLVVRRSLIGLHEVPASQRADLLEGAALILEGQEAEEASRAAQSIRVAEDAQLTLVQLLEGDE